MNQKIFIVFLHSFSLQPALKAFTLSGYITDDAGTPLPFVSVMVKGANTVSTSNEKGFYSFTLAAGEYEITFSYIGYVQQIKKINIEDQDYALNITMSKTILVLKEVNINGNDEDPAYRIIREAQKKRKYYLEQVNAYSCDVYIKGLQRLKEVPKKIMGFKRETFLGGVIGLDLNGRGILYLSESVYKI